MKQASFTVEPTPPYDFDLTASYITYFRGRYATDTYDKGILSRLLDVEGKLVLASVSSSGDIDSPSLDVELRGDKLDGEVIAQVRPQLEWMLDTNDDLIPFYDMASDDLSLKPVISALHGLHVARTASAFEALVLAILGQQISTHVARMLRTLLIETYGRSLEVDGESHFTFPSPHTIAQLEVSDLRGIKFSARKSEYIIDIASKVASGELNLEAMRHLPSDEVVKGLVKIRGIGPWTAHWLLIRALGHPDGIPYGDLALQRIVGLLANGGDALSARETLEYSERWSPYRSYVTTYLFAAARAGRIEELAQAGDVGP